MSEDQIKELLHEMREDPVPADSLVRVRQAVMAAQDSASTVRWRVFGPAWKFAVVFALVAFLGVVFLRSRGGRPTVASPPVTAALKAPEPAPTPLGAREGQPVRHKVRAARRLQPPAAQPLPQSVIRIETPDPEVVILLLADSVPAKPRDPVARE